MRPEEPATAPGVESHPLLRQKAPRAVSPSTRTAWQALDSPPLQSQGRVRFNVRAATRVAGGGPSLSV